MTTYRHAPRDAADVARRVGAGVGALLAAMPGFRGCHLFPGADRTVVVGLFGGEAQALAAARESGAWGREGLARLLAGELGQATAAALFAVAAD